MSEEEELEAERPSSLIREVFLRCSDDTILLAPWSSPEETQTEISYMLQEAFEFTLELEGGWYPGNEARDPNPTNFGVTQSTYEGYRKAKKLPSQTVKNISMSEVKDIYDDYWVPAGCNLVGKLASITLFDHSINAGPSNAAKALQRAVGSTPDGRIGPNTRAAVAGAVSKHGDPILAAAISFERLRHYVNVAKDPVKRPNLLSWTHRIVKFYESFLK